MSRCSLENPNSDERCFRTTSPSSKVVGLPPISINFTNSALAIVDLPDPDSPVMLDVELQYGRLAVNGGDFEQIEVVVRTRQLNDSELGGVKIGDFRRG